MFTNLQTVKTGKGLFLASLALAALLIFSTSTAFGQVFIGEEDKGPSYTNEGNVGTATVDDGGELFNKPDYDLNFCKVAFDTINYGASRYYFGSPQFSYRTL
ncbi:MAG: hypothetical protein FWE95_08005 [Planctomycetaceae bacterium]|nr:hypothetical protein [Planctomycetaceae bacterium]